MKIVVAQFHTKNIDYAKYSTEINRLYCEKHGYEYFVESDTDKIKDALASPYRSPTWYKPKLILDVLETHNPDYVLFLDIDAVVVDFEDTIEKYISPEHDLVFANDYGPHSTMNAGVFLLKNTPWVKSAMQQWWELGDTLVGDSIPHLSVPEQWKVVPGYFRTGLWHDQSCLTYLYQNDEEFKEKTKVISHRRFNWREPFDANFIYHGFAHGDVPFRRLNYVHSKITSTPLESNVGKTLMELSIVYPSDKEHLHQYFTRVYNDLLVPRRDSTQTILEIGVGEGYSLATWRDFFPNATVIGVDNNPAAGEFVRSSGRVILSLADTGDVNDLLRIQRTYQNVDIILDDGGHRMHEQQFALVHLLPMLKDTGLYILEDLHTSTEAKMPEKEVFGWGDPNKTTTLDMLRHYQKTGKIVSDYYTPEQCKYLEDTIDSVVIYDELGEMTGITSIITKRKVPVVEMPVVEAPVAETSVVSKFVSKLFNIFKR